MSDALKNLGQSMPAAASLTTLYTVPSGKSAVLSSLMVCNQSDSAAKFRVSHAVAAAADAAAQYLYHDIVVPPHSTFAATLGISLAATDVLRARSDNGLCSFNAYGTEVT